MYHFDLSDPELDEDGDFEGQCIREDEAAEGLSDYQIDLLAAQYDREKIEFSRLPWWIRAGEFGDYMRDGSDLQEYNEED
jgi:hypothetical protein